MAPSSLCDHFSSSLSLARATKKILSWWKSRTSETYASATGPFSVSSYRSGLDSWPFITKQKEPRRVIMHSSLWLDLGLLRNRASFVNRKLGNQEGVGYGHSRRNECVQFTVRSAVPTNTNIEGPTVSVGQQQTCYKPMEVLVQCPSDKVRYVGTLYMNTPR